MYIEPIIAAPEFKAAPAPDAGKALGTARPPRSPRRPWAMMRSNALAGPEATASVLSSLSCAGAVKRSASASSFSIRPFCRSISSRSRSKSAARAAVLAGSAAQFAGAQHSPQEESTEQTPTSSYGLTKVLSAQAVRFFREQRGMHASTAILYNHESPLRGEGFVTRRITMAVARIAKGLQDTLELGDIEVARDWGWAPDYVRGMQMMLRADVPHDYVLATEISHRLSFFLDRAFMAAGVREWQKYVVSTSDRMRSTDTNKLVGDSRAASKELGWRHTVDFDSMAAAMVRHDMALLDDPSRLWVIP